MTLPLLLENFHFLRPLWLLAVIPAGLLSYYFWQQKSSRANWNGAIQSHLLSHLIDGEQSNTTRWPWIILLLCWVMTVFALAGPTWNKLPQPIMKKQDALIIVIDLSLSMLAEDIKPSRITRAQHKVLDIIKHRNEGLTGLIAYSGDAHIVSPLTDDTATIANLTPALSPQIMPVYGSNPVDALQLAQQLFENAKISSGRILLITDGITADDVNTIQDDLSRDNIDLSIMGIGTTDGAPIPASKGFLKDNQGNIVVPQLKRAPMEELAKQNSGRYTDVTLNDTDIHFLLPQPTTELDDNVILTEREFDQWLDRGPYIVLLLLPLALLGFRKGWLLLLPLVIGFQPETSYALNWNDLWLRADQQAAKAMKQGDINTAAETFENAQWRGAAQYQSNAFEDAAKSFSSEETATALYNKGNALAKAGKLDESIASYQQALEKDPHLDDAKFNQALVEQVKKQQKQNQQKQKQDQDQDQDQDQESSEQQDSDNNSPSPQSSDDQQPSNQGDEKSQEDHQNSQESDQEKSDERESNESNPPTNSDENTNESKEQPAQAEQVMDQPEDSLDGEEHQASMKNQQQQQATEQWLRKIPDDPSGLLRRKFNYEYQSRQQRGQTSKEQPTW